MHFQSKTVDNAEYIPGSDYIFASSYENAETLQKHKDIVLIPQPSASPNDPLNWPRWRRLLQIGIILFLRGVTTAVADDSFSIIEKVMIDQPELSTGSFTSASAVLFVGIGAWALINAPSAALWGCRISYIVGCTMGIIGNALFSQIKSKGMLYASQFFIGAATSVGESVAILSIAHLTFQHQINDVIGLYVLSTSAGQFAGPLIDGYVSENLGWQWVGYFGMIFECVSLVLVTFGLEETYFDRAHSNTFAQAGVIEGVPYGESDSPRAEKCGKDGVAKVLTPVKDTRMSADSLTASDPQRLSSIIPQRSVQVLGLDMSEAEGVIVDTPKTYRQRIALITRATNLRGYGFRQYGKRVVLLCRVFAFPPVVYSGLQWAIQLGFTGIYKSIETDSWSKGPWYYNSGSVALMMMPNLIGAAIGSLYSTWLADWFVRYMARRNNGLHEAESRLWLMIPVAILYPLGLILFGVGTHNKWSWPPVYVGLGFVGFGFGASGEISISYMTDCYPGMVLEGMVGLVCVYTMSSLIISLLAKDWISIGDQNAVIICAVLGFFIIGLSLPMGIYGKRMRRKTRGMYFRFIAMRDSLDQE